MGETFGPYVLVERIAVGGMAEVFLARGPDTRRALVVKKMLAQLNPSHEHVTMFLDEGKLGTLLKHKNIVDILDIGQIDGAWFMALEYVDGPDLGQILKTARDAQSPMPAVLAAYIVARAAEGLHFAHGVVDAKTGAPLGVIHRDVSPQNILVSRDGAVKIGDFGVAKSDQQMHQTQTGLVKGKIAYMSPEQIAAQTLDVRTDVLALGVCLWEALTHKRMYSGLSDVQMMKKIYFDNPPAPSSTGAVVDEALALIVMRALARRRVERQSSAHELAADLDGWLAGRATAEDLGTWMKARFVPRAVVDDAATAWAYQSPARGSVASGEGETVTTELDEGLRVEDEGSAVVEKPATKALPKGTMLRPLQRGNLRVGPKRDLVLYVEDEQQNWEVAELLLRKNYDLVHASDDQMACEIVRTRGRELTAVLMDIQLKGSELDGIALVKLLRGALAGNIPSYARGIAPLALPIFFVTAYAARYSEKELLAVGADKLVTKPVDFAQLTLALTSYQLRRAAPGGAP